MDLFHVFTADEQAEAQAALNADRAARAERREVFEYRVERKRYEEVLATVADWQPPALPQLDAFDEVIIDLETDGLRWWGDNRLIGAGLRTPDGQTRYLPIRHKVGPNIPEEQFFEWCRRELRGKRVLNIRTKFDLHMFRADSIDLEAQGCTFGDVAHYAALLDDHRVKFNQHDLVRDFVKYLPPDAGKITEVNGFKLNPTKFAEYPAGLVAPRAESDVQMVHLLREVMWPQLTAQDLHRVRAVEDQIIPVVVEMEHNGAPLDVELLDRWVREATADMEAALLDIKRLTGVDMKTPNNHADTMRIFNILNIQPPEDPEDKDKISFADALLKPIEHDAIQRLRAARQLASLLSKFLIKYQRSTVRDGILRFELHQLPYQKDDKKQGGFGEDMGGAVSGRFSSAAPSKDEGANIQQVFGVDIQKKFRPFTAKYLVKKLFIPDRKAHPNAVYVNADASQLQLRIFAHYGEDPKIIEAYRSDLDWRAIDARAEAKRAAGLPLGKEDRLVDFHDMVGAMVLEYAHKELIRTHTKNVNFAQVFGAGIRKMAAQIGVPPEQIPDADEPLESGGPLFQEVVKLSATYHSLFPGVKPLLAKTSHLAMPEHRTGKRACRRECRLLMAQGYPHRGWVRTIDGRRARFNVGDRYYSALNRVIQGTEADVIKRVLVAVHLERHQLGLTERFTVHDALAGDLHDPSSLRTFKETLNVQRIEMKVPILWEVGAGANWAEAK